MTASTTLNPLIHWHCKGDTLHLKFDVADASEKNIKLTNDSIHFSGTFNGKCYDTKLDLAHSIQPEIKCDLSMSVKTSEKKWKKLLNGNNKYPWIRFNCSEIEISDDEEEGGMPGLGNLDFANLMGGAGGDDDDEDVGGENEEDSDDETDVPKLE